MLPSTTVGDLEILIDSDVTMQPHALRTVSGCFAMTGGPALWLAHLLLSTKLIYVGPG